MTTKTKKIPSHLMINSRGYLIFKNTKKSYARYKLQKKLGRKLKRWEVTDHINKNRRDNRFSNLRAVTQSQNNRHSGITKNMVSRFQTKMKRR